MIAAGLSAGVHTYKTFLLTRCAQWARCQARSVKTGRHLLCPAGYYYFELRYRNATQAVDITMSTPSAPQAYDYLTSSFLTAQAAPSVPRTYSGPSTSLSSVFQVRPAALALAQAQSPPMMMMGAQPQRRRHPS